VAGDPVERLANLVAMLLDVAEPVPLHRVISEVPGYPPNPESARVQFNRDKTMLASEGIEVETIGAGAGAAYRIDPASYYLPDLGLDDDEALALNLAAGAVRLDGDNPDEALWKVGAAGVAGPAMVALPAEPELPVLYEAVRRRRRTTFTYGGTERDLEPYGLLFRDGYWYLSGHDHLRDDLRTFRLDRIDGPVNVGEPGAFRPPRSFDPTQAMPAQPYALAPGTPVEAQVLVAPLMAARVVREVGPDRLRERRDDGSVVVDVPVANVAGLRSWLFGMLDHARLLGPPDLVDEVTSWLDAMAGEGS
jgi:proteasome accessory factor B